MFVDGVFVSMIMLVACKKQETCPRKQSKQYLLMLGCWDVGMLGARSEGFAVYPLRTRSKSDLRPSGLISQY